MVDKILKTFQDVISIYKSKRSDLYGDIDYIVFVKKKKLHSLWFNNIELFVFEFDNFIRNFFMANRRNDFVLVWGKDIWEDKQYNNKLPWNKEPRRLFFHINETNYKRVAYAIKKYTEKYLKILEWRNEPEEPPNFIKFDYNELNIDKVKEVAKQYEKWRKNEVKKRKECNSNSNMC